MRQVPNAVTLVRLLLIPVLVMLLARRDYAAAFAAFFISALSDFADGVIARRWNARTRFGAIADPVLDKLTMLSVTLTLAVQGLLPLWLVAAIVARDLVIVGGALAYHYSVGRYNMAPTLLSKINTAIEFFTLAMVLGGAADLFIASRRYARAVHAAHGDDRCLGRAVCVGVGPPCNQSKRWQESVNRKINVHRWQLSRVPSRFCRLAVGPHRGRAGE